MKRVIDFRFSGFDKVVTADLLDKNEPHYAEVLWEALKTLPKMWSWHTTSSGDWFSSKPRTPPHPVATASQVMPIGKKRLMCDFEPGMILYAGAKGFSYCYGPDVTEPLPARGPIIAMAQDLELFYQAGLHVWDAQYRTHKLITVTATGREI